MKSVKKKIIIYLSVMSLILLFISLLVTPVFPSLPITPAYPYILIFFYLVTLLIFYILGRSMQKRIGYFVNSYMIITFVKLLVFSLVILAYLFLNKKDAIPFVVTFFIYYLFYAIFEVIALRQMSESTK
ncbi:MAG: hypothetical protein IH595_08800 [Bacteroidales bacterium]|nr:hypothetical protein [Bacteroidales bacterium]